MSTSQSRPLLFFGCSATSTVARSAQMRDAWATTGLAVKKMSDAINAASGADSANRTERDMGPSVIASDRLDAGEAARLHAL